MDLTKINYPVDKGIGLQRTLSAQGLRLWEQTDMGHVTPDDGPTVQAIVDAYDPLPDQQAERRAELAAVMGARLALGFTWQGVTHQIDAASQLNITARGAMAVAVLSGAPGAQWPADFYWIAADNSHVPMDAAAMYAFAQAAGDHVTKIILNGRKLKDAINAAPADALKAIDLSQGWPE